MRDQMQFKLARPVWAEHAEEEKNCQLGFVRKFSNHAGKAMLYIATAGQYFLYLNGSFITFGPARGPKGFFRVDTISLSIPEGENVLAILAINPGICSFELIRQSAFLQAELVCEDKILAATGVEEMDFTGFRLTEYVRKIQRYSYQRTFAEGYRLTPSYRDWMRGKACSNAIPCNIVVQKEAHTGKEEQHDGSDTKGRETTHVARQYLSRGLKEAAFPKVRPDHLHARGQFEIQEPKNPYRDRSLTNACESPANRYLEGFQPMELEWQLSEEVQSFHTSELVPQEYDLTKSADSQQICGGEFVILQWPQERSGFLSLSFSCKEAGSLYLVFDEIPDAQGDVDPMRLTCCNAVRLDCEKGDYTFQSRKSYSMRYCKLLAKSGSFEIPDIWIDEVICPEHISWNYHSKDSKTEAILQAAKQTFLQNSSDIFMDCPSRERAGWLCDSFFLGRAEYEFTGHNAVERNFLENYGLPESFETLPDGMVPMCYPSNQTVGGPEAYIPNWALWLLLELTEYYGRTGDNDIKNLYERRTSRMLAWFAQYENGDGLLEKVPGWVFVEWSKANEFVQDINYPTNMLYGKALKEIGKLYDQHDLMEKGERILNLVRKRSFDGEFFTDNAICTDEGYLGTSNRTETCQYYAFFTGTATPDTYPVLWDRLVREFGPQREKNGSWPEIYPSNAFIGNYLRMILLVRYGYYRQMLNESIDYFYYMADKTGTLWEHVSDTASCNHGFTSYIAYLIRVSEEAL